MILSLYTSKLGQLINRDKSTIIFFNTNQQVQRCITNLLGFRMSELPCTYLGVPIFHSATKAKHWKGVIESCQKKAASWKGKWLTLSSRLTMIKAVIAAIPIYTMSTLQLPKSTEMNINITMKHFLWEGSNESHHVPLLN